MSAVDAAKQAARMGDPIEHGIGLWGMLAGMLLGALVGVILIAATGGAALAIIGAVGAVAGGGLAGGQLARGLNSLGILPSGIATGTINPVCSPDVVTGYRPAARAVIDTGNCNGILALAHIPMPPLPLPPIAEGSATVLINFMNAARQKDKLVCGANIQLGEPTVIIGGETVRLLEVEDLEAELTEILGYVAIGAAVAGLLLLAGSVAVGAICGTVLLKTIVIGALMVEVNWMLGEIGDAIGPGWRDTLQGGFGIGGLLVSGYKGLKMFEGRPFISEPVDAVTGEVCMQQTDFTLPAALPLVLSRTYVSGAEHESSFGPKWRSTWGQWIRADGRKAVYFTDDGRGIDFDLPEASGEARNRYVNKIRLRRTPSGFAVRDEANRTLLFEREIEGRWSLTAIEDPNGSRIDLFYDAQGALMAVTHSGGYQLRIDATPSAIKAIELVKPDGNSTELVRYEYDAEGCLSGVIKNGVRVMRFDYDAEARLERWEDSRGTWFAYKYDEGGRCIEGRGPRGMYNSRFVYHDATRTNYYTDSLGNTTKFVYNERLQVVERTDARGGVTRTEWDERSNKLKDEDPNGNATELEYDRDGNVIRAVNALGQVVELSYNQFGQAVVMTDAAGKLWSRRFDDKGNLLQAGEAGGKSYTYQRDEKGRLIRLKDWAGKSRAFGYDTRGLIIWDTDWEQNRTAYRRDDLGRIVERIDSLGNRTGYEYTATDYLSQIILPTGARVRWDYDREGNVERYVDAAGREYRFRYGVFDLLEEERKPGGGRLRYRYDTEARLVAVENELGEEYRYKYNETGEVIRERDFAGRVLMFEYDAAGNSTKQVNGLGQETHLRRDALGRLSRKVLAEGDESHFEYNVYGNLVKAANGAVAVLYERDEYGRVVKETQGEVAIESEYDGLGMRTKRRTSSGHLSEWSYDGNGLPKSLSLSGGESVEFRHDAEWRETERRMKGGLVLRQEYDALDRLVKQLAGVEQGLSEKEESLIKLVASRDYKYDESGNPIEIKDGFWGTNKYSYDADGQVRRVEREDGSFEEYEYDLAGNITRGARSKAGLTAKPQVGAGSTASLGARDYETGGRLRRAGRTRYEYDGDGRVVARIDEDEGRWRYEWTSEGRLRSVRTPKGERWEYSYDALGRRMSKSGPTGSTKYTWDGAVVAEEVRPNGETAVWEYEPGTFRPLLKQEGELVYACITDQVGLPRELITSGGEVAWNARTSLWGEVEEVAFEETECSIRFQGQWYDEESGLAYNWHRYYEPQTGYYMSADPIGLVGGSNLYSYVPNPLTWVDPLGLAGCGTGEGAAKSLPQLKGKSPTQIRKILQKSGFTRTNVSSSAARNETWTHPDGSEVRIHPYGNQNTGPYKSGNNAHVHKQNSVGDQLNDRGIPSTNPAETHVGIPNPPDLPVVRGRPHGTGTN